jgi:hypothetical protein
MRSGVTSVSSVGRCPLVAQHGKAKCVFLRPDDGAENQCRKRHDGTFHRSNLRWMVFGSKGLDPRRLSIRTWERRSPGRGCIPHLFRESNDGTVEPS